MWLFSVKISFIYFKNHSIMYLNICDVWLWISRCDSCFYSVPVLAHTAWTYFLQRVSFLFQFNWGFFHWSLNLNNNFMLELNRKTSREKKHYITSMIMNIPKLTICTWNCKNSRVQTQQGHHRKHQRKDKENKL